MLLELFLTPVVAELFVGGVHMLSDVRPPVKVDRAQILLIKPEKVKLKIKYRFAKLKEKGKI